MSGNLNYSLFVKRAMQSAKGDEARTHFRLRAHTRRIERSNRGKRAASDARLLFAFLAPLTAATLAIGQAWAVPSCPVSAPISTCCIADQPATTYQLGGDITASGECIDISARNVLFYLNGHTISGPVGAGIGIHVLSTAANVTVSGSGGGVVQKFATGFQSDAPNTFTELLRASLNDRGFVLNGPEAFAFLLTASANLKNGIVADATAKGSLITDPISTGNGANGIVLNGATGVTVVSDVRRERGLRIVAQRRLV